MKSVKSILAIAFLLVNLGSYGQFFTPTQLNTIHINKTAFEGDMYLDTVNKQYYIGLTTGELSRTGHIDSIGFSNDTLTIFQGDSSFKVEIISGGIINGLDNSTVYFVNSSAGGGTGTAQDTGCPNGEITIKRMIEGNCDYGYQGQAFIGCDDNIWVCGDASTTGNRSPFGHPNTTSDATRLFKMPVNPADTRNGKWKYIWATRGSIWALTDSGELFRAGDANSGQLGNNSTTDDIFALTKLPFSDTLSDKIVYLYAGSSNHSSIFYASIFVLTEGGDVYAWGENQYRQMGDGTTTDVLLPQKIAALDAPFIRKMSVADMRYATCFAIDNANNLYSWGYNNSGGLGNGTNSGNVAIPTLVVGIKVSDVKGVGYLPTTRIITLDSSTMASGENGDRQIGDNTNGDKNTFTDIFYNTTNDTLRNNIAEIDMWSHNGNGGSLLVTYDRELWVCGGNTDRQQGIGPSNADQGIFQKPVAPFQGMIRKAIFVGADNGEVSITVLDTLGRIWTCGDNIRGQTAEATLISNNQGVFQLAITAGDEQGSFIDIKAFGRTSVPGFAALTRSGRVFVTGSDSQQQAGVGDYPAGNVNFLRPIVFEQ